MKQVTKVIMYVYREHNGQKQFFVLHRKSGDNVVLTGHVGDTIPDESLEQAVKREVREELGVETLKVLNLDYSVTVKLEKHNKVSEEHGFLIKIPDQYVYFLDGDEKHGWHALKDLERILTYDSQKDALDKIKAHFN